VTARVI